MKKTILIIITSFLSTYAICSDSTTAGWFQNRPITLSLRGESGAMLKTIGFLQNSPYHTNFKSLSMRVGFKAREGSWQESFYHNSTFGIGLSSVSVADKEHIGVPTSIFAFYNANLWRFNDKFSLDYELNLGPSFGWTPYDPFTNPDNIITASRVNVYAGLHLMFNWKISNNWNLKAGGSATHYSNGSSQIPCKGLNNVGAFVDLSYTIAPRERKLPQEYIEKTPPQHKAKLIHDIQFVTSTRQITVDEWTKPDCYIKNDFQIFGLSYAAMVERNRRFRWGVSADIIYDESSNATFSYETPAGTNRKMTKVELATFGERFTVGLSIKGELVNPYYTIFANIGYNVITSHKLDDKLFQTIGVKAYVNNNIYALFGVKAKKFGKAEYMLFGLGFQLDDKLPKFLRKRK